MGTRNVEDWSTAKAAANAARDKDHGFILDHATRVRVSKDKHGYHNRDVDPEKAVYAIVHFSTEVVYFYPDGRISINLHGWDTVTTKRRIRRYTRASVGSYRGATHLHTYGAYRPIDPCEEYFIENKSITDSRGISVREAEKVGAPRRLPKTRNTVQKPKRGDAFRSPDGRSWIVARMSKYDNQSAVVEYHGDFQVRPAFAVTGPERIPLTPIFQLTMLDWKPIERFNVEDEVKHVA